MGLPVRASKELSSDVSSFFKVMIGDDYSEVMLLPPRFVRTVSNLVDQEIKLEDANGLSWTVTLSKHKGSLAFRKGWHAFSSGHNLKIGDFLVFVYLKHAHFVVTVYGRSGCEKLSLPEYTGSKRKRKRNNESSIDRNKCFRQTNSDNDNGQCSNTSAVSIPHIDVNQSTPMVVDNTSNTDDSNNVKVFSKMNLTEEPFYMINVGVGQSDHRDSLYDLASFEMRPADFPESGKTVLQNERSQEQNATFLKFDVPESGKTVLENERPLEQNAAILNFDVPESGITVLENERSQEQNATIPNFESEVSTVGEIPVSKEVQSCQALPEVLNLEVMQESRDVRQLDNNTQVAKNNSKSKIASSRKQHISTGSGKEQFSASRKRHPSVRVSGQSAEKKVAGSLDFSDLAISIKNGTYSSGKCLKVVKQEQVEMKEEVRVRGVVPGKSLKVVKQEQVERQEEGSVHGEGKEEGCVHGGIPGYQWTMKLDHSSYPSGEINNHDPNVVKAEPVDAIDLNCTFVAKIPFSEKQAYLELPDRLVPSPSWTKQRSGRKVVVYLRGPVSSVWMWPVLYHERYGHKVLTSGWDAFRKANGFSPGDECVFRQDDQYELIFVVSLLTK